jgi:peptidyl-prolyl cis-trans isomerase A (cyclophilin A)/peptidyl-prolyl cis-trans isomerase B (cyclophilin B)
MLNAEGHVEAGQKSFETLILIKCLFSRQSIALMKTITCRKTRVNSETAKFLILSITRNSSMQAMRRRVFIFISSLLMGIASMGAYAADAAPANPHVALKTSMGEIVLELYPDKAPKTVENFLMYVKAGHYSGTIFHRVIDGFMIQGGGFDKDMKQKPVMSHVENEAKNGLKNDAYTVAMARTSDPHSASTQFFINVNNNDFLNYPGQDGWGYCVFGKVIKGKEVVDKIKAVPTTTVGPFANVPATPVVIESATLLK